jgi:hypothetical protein
LQKQQRVCKCIAGCLKRGIGCEPTELADGVLCGLELIESNRLKIVGPGHPDDNTLEIEILEQDRPTMIEGKTSDDLEKEFGGNSDPAAEVSSTVDSEDDTPEPTPDSGCEPTDTPDSSGTKKKRKSSSRNKSKLD